MLWMHIALKVNMATKKKKKGILGLFGIMPNPKKQNLVPAKKTKSDGEDDKLRPIKLPSDLERAWEFFQSDFTLISDQNTPNNRLSRYNDLQFMVYNEGLMHTAAQIYASETTNTDEQNRIIGIKAKNKAREKAFYKWMQKVGYTNSVLKAISWDITVFGDAQVINSVDLAENGIEEVVTISPKDVVDRLEFQGIKVKESMENTGMSNSYSNLQSRSETLKDLYTKIENLNVEESYFEAYKTYLFGFLVGKLALCPWEVTHFRRFSSGSEFAPFGRPLFMGSVARYKSYKATELIIDAARMASFPTKVFEIKGHEDMSAAELNVNINRVRQMYENVTSENKTKDELSINEAIYTVEGLVSFQQFESRIDLNQVGDLENKRKDLILSTGIPEGYLIPDRGGFGNSGQALLQQSKIVARRVYDNQTAILDALLEQYRLHLYITEGEEAYKEDFEIYMNYPVVEEAQDRTRLKSDTIRLATDIIANLGQSVGLDRGEALPIDVVRDVFAKYSFLDMEEVSGWLDTFMKSKDVIEEQIQKLDALKESEEQVKKENNPMVAHLNNLVTSRNFYNSIKHLFNEKELPKKLREKIEDRLSDVVVRNQYFESKRNLGITESSIGGKHSKTSFSRPSNSLEISIMEVKCLKNKRLVEDENNIV